MVGTVVEYIRLSNACSSVTIATCRYEFDYVKNCVFCDQAIDCCIEGIVCVRCFFDPCCAPQTEVERMHHACQLFQACQFIADTCGEDPAIFCGDFNMKDHETPYLVITDTLGFTDSFAGDGRPTCHHPHNIYRSDTPRRIDYIFFSSNGKKDMNVRCVGRDLALSGTVPGQEFNYSDHEGLESVVEIEHSDPSSRAGKGCLSIAKRFVGEWNHFFEVM